MRQKIETSLNKIILLILIIFMILPFSINIMGVSLAKICTIILILIFVYLFITRKDEIVVAFKNRFILFNILFALIVAISIIYNSNSMQFNDLYEILKYMLFSMVSIIIINICKDKSNYLFFMKTISIALIVISIFGIIQYFNPFSINELYIKSYAQTQYETLVHEYPSPRIVGTKANPAVYGVLMSLGVYINLLYFRNTKIKKEKILIVISIILCIINLILTLTRTIQIAFMISIIIYILCNVWIKKGFKKALIAMLSTILGICLILCILPQSLTWRLVQVLDISNATSWILRTEKWMEYSEIIEQNLLFGIGPVKNSLEEIGYVDSEFVQITLQYGLIGLIIYVVMLLTPLYIYFKDRRYKNLIRFYTSLLTIIFINNISNTSLILFDTAIGIYVLIGLLFIPEQERENE